MPEYPRSLDIDEDNIIANTWNLWRMSRVRILNIIGHCAAILDYGGFYTDSVQPTTAIQQLVDDICSSVPFHFGFRLEDLVTDKSFYPYVAGDARWLDRFGTPETLGGLLLISPLEVAVATNCVLLGQRMWMQEYLKGVNKEPAELIRQPLKVEMH